jgi:hypothetical protein
MIARQSCLTEFSIFSMKRPSSVTKFVVHNPALLKNSLKSESQIASLIFTFLNTLHIISLFT